MSITKDTLQSILAFAIVFGVFGYNYYSDKQEELVKQEAENKKIQEQKWRDEQILKDKLSEACNYDLAYNTALRFLEKENLEFISLNHQEMFPENCAIDYAFKVRIIKYNQMTRDAISSDKVYTAKLTLKKYNDFYGIELAELVDPVNHKYESLL